jgi:hypothetical protein
MLSRTGSWMIAVGAVLVFMGLTVLPSAFGENADHNMLGVGTSLISMGLFLAANGVYFKVRALQPSTFKKEDKPAAKAIRGGCDRCQAEPPVVHCKVHQQHLCGKCLAEHYDFRACVYTPSTRREAAVKAMAAKAR